MTAVPAATPLTTPVPEPTDAVPDALLVHTPPEGELLNVVVAPSHTVGTPVIAPGALFTVTVFVATQLAGPCV